MIKPISLLLQGITSVPKWGTLDLMEYPDNATAQAAYVSNAAPYRSNADIDDEDMVDITDWTDADAVTGDSSQATFDGKSCMKLDTGSTVLNSQAIRRQDVGTFGTRTVFTFSLYCETIGTAASQDRFNFGAFNGSTKLNTRFSSDGLYIYDGAAWNEVGTDIVSVDTWQEWTFDVNWTAQTVDVYVNGILKASGVDCSQANATANGTVEFLTSSVVAANILAYIDWFKAGSDFIAGAGLQSYSEPTIKTQGSYSLKAIASTSSLNKTLTRTIASPIDLTGQTKIKFDMRASRTGSNVKVGIHDAGGTTTETTPNIASADTFQTVEVDISGVADADKNAIDRIIITPTNADSANTVYLDYLRYR